VLTFGYEADFLVEEAVFLILTGKGGEGWEGLIAIFKADQKVGLVPLASFLVAADTGCRCQLRELRFHENAAPVSTASSVQVRQPLYSGSIGRWKRYGADGLAPLRQALGELAED